MAIRPSDGADWHGPLLSRTEYNRSTPLTAGLTLHSCTLSSFVLILSLLLLLATRYFSALEGTPYIRSVLSSDPLAVIARI